MLRCWTGSNEKRCVIEKIEQTKSLDGVFCFLLLFRIFFIVMFIHVWGGYSYMQNNEKNKK